MGIPKSISLFSTRYWNLCHTGSIQQQEIYLCPNIRTSQNTVSRFTMSSEKFCSEGFDLDAIPGVKNEGEGEIVYEIGGKVSRVNAAVSDENKVDEKNECDKEEDPLAASEELKGRGNKEFKAGNYLDAYDFYTDAVEACPGMSGSDILQLREQHAEKEREKAYARHRAETERRRSRNTNDESGETTTNDEKSLDPENDPAEFEIPPHEYGDKLAVYHCNRAACLLHLGRNEEAITDCDIAILLNPKYVKAMIRRMTAFENTERTEDALNDAKMAQTLDPANADIRRHVNRLQKIENERMEKLKEETMGKLKDLGNSILGNFGLSLDNFKAQQDPNTGSYNISFENK